VKDRCGFSLAALVARSNLHLEEVLTVKNVSQEEAAKAELLELAGNEQAPTLVDDGVVTQDSIQIVDRLAARYAPLLTEVG
jgi:glutathione S-transferase